MPRPAGMRCCGAVTVALLFCAAVSAAPGKLPAKSGKLPKYGTIEKEIFEPGDKYVASSWEDKQKTHVIEISANKHNATVHVNGRLAWWRTLDREKPDPADPSNVQSRGLYVLALHPITGRVQREAVASGWMQLDTAHAVREMVRDCRRGDVLLFFSAGEIGPGLTGDSNMVRFMARMGAEKFREMGENDMLALVRVKGGRLVAETYVRNPLPQMAAAGRLHSSPLMVSAVVPVPPVKDVLCPWIKTPKNLERAKFCFKYDGYGDLCDCEKDDLLPFHHEELEHNNLTDVPIAVVASNRPQALFRMMSTLLKNRGVIVSNIIVFVDGDHAEVNELCDMLGIKCVAQGIHYYDVTMRIQEHYRQVLTDVWIHFPNATRVIVLEEDLEVSPDFISYFSQTSHLLDVDPSLWCVSAWNDHAYDVTSSDPALLYRIEYMPGLGWMMTKSVIQELLEKWPGSHQAYDWDVWVRWDSNRLERECVIPDVSRTYHFGITGRHSTSTFHTMYYVDHAFNRQPDVVLKGVEDMVKDRYEEEIKRLISQAEPIAPDAFELGGTQPNDGGDCDLPMDDSGKTYAVFFSMKNWEDDYLYKTLGKCFRIWDLDVRGHHRGLWRFTYYDNNILMFGVPVNMYMNDVLKLFRHPIQVISPQAARQ